MPSPRPRVEPLWRACPPWRAPLWRADHLWKKAAADGSAGSRGAARGAGATAARRATLRHRSGGGGMNPRRQWWDSAREAALDPSRPIVDPHHHLWKASRWGEYLL